MSSKARNTSFAAHLEPEYLLVTPLDVQTILLLELIPCPRGQLTLVVSMAEIEQQTRNEYVVIIDVAVAPPTLVDDTERL